MAKAFKAKTLTQLHTGLCEYIVNAPVHKLDMATSVDVQIHNVVAEAESMKWDFDLKDMWLTPSRWTMMVKQYLDPDDLIEWLNRTAHMIGWNQRGISMLRTKTVAPRGGKQFGNKETRRWGSCMLAISYKAVPYPQITLHSRTSYLGYLGALDISVAWMCGRYLAAVMNGEVERMRFLWMNEAMQFHNFKSLAFLLNHREPEKRVLYRHYMLDPDDALTAEERAYVASRPGLQSSRRWMQNLLKQDREGQTLGDMSYNTYRRIKRRYHTEVMGYDYAKEFEGWQYWKKGPQVGEKRAFHKAYPPLPNTPIQSRDFTPLGLPPLESLWDPDYESPAESIEDDGE